MNDILSKIVRDAQVGLEARVQRVSRTEMERLARAIPPTHNRFSDAFRIPGLHVIAELKKASPSRGVIRNSFPYRELAVELAENGAAALSVLTEENYFLGSPDFLRDVAQTVSVPVLRKDFIRDPYLIFEAKVLGASAVLLIARMLEDAELRELAKLASELGLDVLGEAHDAREIDRLAAVPEVTLIGVNARDLRTFETSLETVTRLISRVPADRLPVAESAIRTPADVRSLREAGAVGFLIGETLMRSERPGLKLREILEAAR